MINLDQSIAKVKADVNSALARTRAEGDPPEPGPRDLLIETIMHEGAGRDRKTLLAWLNEQVEATGEGETKPMEEDGEGPPEPKPVETLSIEHRGDLMPGTTTPSARLDIPPARKPDPVYRPEKRGNVWCVLDTANARMRKETFENKGDASAFIVRLDLDVNGLIEERSYHFKRAA